MSYADAVVSLVKASVQQRHQSGQYAHAGRPEETRMLSDGKRAKPLHVAIREQVQQTMNPQEADDAADS